MKIDISQKTIQNQNMLGWFIQVEKAKADNVDSNENIIAKWETSVNGLSWIQQLVKNVDAVYLGGNGYPYRFSIKAEICRNIMLDGLPTLVNPRDGWSNSYLPKPSHGHILNVEQLNSCLSDEELVIKAWDLS